MLFSRFIVALSPDGKLLATTAVDGAVSLWNIADPTRPQKVGASLTSDPGGLVMLAFSPDGKTLAADAENDTVILWDVTDVNYIVQHALEKACERAGRGFNAAEWARYVGTEYQRTCP
jgi:WD40 repeat protein